MKWGDCEIVYNKDKREFSKKHYKNLLKYLSLYRTALDCNVWFDEKSKEYFSAAQHIATSPAGQHHSFITSREEFLLGEFPRSSAWVKSKYETLRNSFGNIPEVVTPDLRCGYNEVIKQIHKQESVFIVGAGPSTSKIDFEKFSHIPKWTMNYFFKNKKIKNLENIQLVTLLDDVNISDEELSIFLQNKNPFLAQEISDHHENGKSRISAIKNKVENSTYLFTRYRSRIGAGARLVVFAILMGIKNIYISGLDGYDITSSDIHIFEENKSLPRWLVSSPHAGLTLQKQQFIVFWDYILNDLRKVYDFKIHDLSKGQNTVKYDFIQDYIN